MFSSVRLETLEKTGKRQKASTSFCEQKEAKKLHPLRLHERSGSSGNGATCAKNEVFCGAFFQKSDRLLPLALPSLANFFGVSTERGIPFFKEEGASS